MRSTYCSSFRSPGISDDLLPISRTMIFLPMSWAVLSSGLHQSDASHSGLDERKDDFAALRRLLQRLLPTLAGRDAALGIKIEEDVVPAVRGEPARGPRWPGRYCGSND